MQLRSPQDMFFQVPRTEGLLSGQLQDSGMGGWNPKGQGGAYVRPVLAWHVGLAGAKARKLDAEKKLGKERGCL
jgi:hypothetical protein